MLPGEQHNGHAVADKSATDSLMQTLVHAYCGENASALAYESATVST